MKNVKQGVSCPCKGSSTNKCWVVFDSAWVTRNPREREREREREKFRFGNGAHLFSLAYSVYLSLFYVSFIIKAKQGVAACNSASFATRLTGRKWELNWKQTSQCLPVFYFSPINTGTYWATRRRTGSCSHSPPSQPWQNNFFLPNPIRCVSMPYEHQQVTWLALSSPSHWRCNSYTLASQQ